MTIQDLYLLRMQYPFLNHCWVSSSLSWSQRVTVFPESLASNALPVAVCIMENVFPSESGRDTCTHVGYNIISYSVGVVITHSHVYDLFALFEINILIM